MRRETFVLCADRSLYESSILLNSAAIREQTYSHHRNSYAGFSDFKSCGLLFNSEMESSQKSLAIFYSVRTTSQNQPLLPYNAPIWNLTSFIFPNFKKILGNPAALSDTATCAFGGRFN